ncbi:MAG: hypothetical protein R3D27_10375 [Hyphomicrobiaceae bacterium]
MTVHERIGDTTFCRGVAGASRSDRSVRLLSRVARRRRFGKNHVGRHGGALRRTDLMIAGYRPAAQDWTQCNQQGDTKRQICQRSQQQVSLPTVAKGSAAPPYVSSYKQVKR